MKFIHYAAASAAIAACCALGAVAATPADPNPAMNAPDQLAWQLFLQANGDAGGGNSTFETWASDTDTFRPNPVFPAAPTTLSLHPPALQIAQLKALQKAGKPLPAVPPGKGELEESRRNRPAFDFIVQNRLYSISGLKAAFGKTLSFPVDAMEVKANWVALSDIPKFTGNQVSTADAPKYFHLNKGSDGKTYALVSMHVISKQVPNWSWATFENRFNLGRCDVMGCHDLFGATAANVQPNAATGKPYPDCAKTPALKALFTAAKVDAVFQNYCLKGSQTDFTDNTGLDVRLGNSVTEAPFLASSSCMTCHGRAAWDRNGQATSQAGFVSFNPLTGPVGPIDPHWYWASLPQPPVQGAPGATRTGTSADFVWSIPFCAYDDSDPKNPQLSGCAGK